MKILITGGAGYKGIILAKRLLDLKHNVTVYDNFLYGFNSVLHLLEYQNLTIKNIDVRNIVEKDVKEFDVIFHLAGISGYPACEANPHSANSINVESTQKIVNYLSKHQLILYASTTSFYGMGGNVCTEDTLVNPVSYYGKTKYEAEKIVMEHENAISLRFATIFGISPKMRIPLLVNDFAYKAVNDRNVVIFDGYSKRTFIHIQDAIDAYLFALVNFDSMKNEVFNVGSNDLNFSKLDIANSIKKQHNFEIINSSMPDLDVRNFIISFDKIDNTGFKIKRTLDEGITELLRLFTFYKSHLDYNFI